MTSQVDQQLTYHNQSVREQKRFCQVHPYAECEFLFTNPENTTESPFKCVMCLDKSIDMKHLIPIKQIERSDDNTIFWNWPLPENPALIQKVKEVSDGPRSDVRFRDQIGIYFKELRSKINSKINEIEEAIAKQEEKLWNFKTYIVKEYNSLSSKDELRQFVLDFQTDPDELSSKLRETIASVLGRQVQMQRALEQELEEYSLYMSTVDFEPPKRIMESVLAQLGQISIFLVDDVSDLQRQHNPSNNDLGNGNASALYQLAISKMNVVSQEFEAHLKQHLLRLKRVLDKTDFGIVYQEGKQRLELELLGEQELAQIQHFAELLIQNKKNPRQPREKIWSSELILKLLSNPANQCSPGILNQLQEILQSISCYFSQFAISGQFPQPIDFSRLNKDQLKRIASLTEKMSELSLVPGYNYYSAISPIPQLQFNSNELISSLKKISLQVTGSQEAEVARVLAQLPVLELLPFNFKLGQQLSWTFEKTKYSNSRQLEINQIENGTFIQLNEGFQARAVSTNVLQNDLMYEITCKFNCPFKEGRYSIIGLFEDELIHKFTNYENPVFSSYSEDLNIIIRGVSYNSFQKLDQIKCRICIQSQEVFFFDESFSHILKVKPSFIKTTGKYRFGIYLSSKSGQNGVTFCNIKAFKDRQGINSF